VSRTAKSSGKLTHFQFASLVAHRPPYEEAYASGFQYESPKDALNAIKKDGAWFRVQEAAGGRTGLGIGEGGNHQNVNGWRQGERGRGTHAGSISKKQVCKDTRFGPDPTVILYQAKNEHSIIWR
jgi:hypothetical protein